MKGAKKELGRIADALEGLLALERENAARGREQVERAEKSADGLLEALMGAIEPLLERAARPPTARVEAAYQRKRPAAVQLGGMRVAHTAPGPGVRTVPEED